MVFPERTILIDGSQGEGGGQILRTAVSLSMVTAEPLELIRIRAGRRKPGLRWQHLTAVQAAGTICGARVEGAALGATALTFRPGAVRPGRYTFDIGTAGSTVLLAQTLIPALLCAPRASSLRLVGGTHNPQSPPFEFFERAFLLQLRRMGAQVHTRLERAGYYPAGGGTLELEVAPGWQPTPLTLRDRGRLLEAWGEAVVCGLPRHIAEREVAVAHEALGWNRLAVREDARGVGPGNLLLLTLAFEQVTEVFCAFGRRGVPAETVAVEAVRETQRYLASSAVAGRYLADQLLLPMALAGSGSFTTLRPSAHTLTNARVIERFLPVRIRVDPVGEPSGEPSGEPFGEPFGEPLWEVTVAAAGESER